MTRCGPDLGAVRRRFSSLQGDFTFYDAPGGSQVPDEVGEAMARCLREASANIGAPYETSRRVGGDPRRRRAALRALPRLRPAGDRLRHQHDVAELLAVADGRP